jgi:hypothetical protein
MTDASCAPKIGDVIHGSARIDPGGISALMITEFVRDTDTANAVIIYRRAEATAITPSLRRCRVLPFVSGRVAALTPRTRTNTLATIHAKALMHSPVVPLKLMRTVMTAQQLTADTDDGMSVIAWIGGRAALGLALSA